LSVPWSTAVNELRYAIADNPKDKLRYRKEVIGTVDGVNTIFKTFEIRRLTLFTTGSTGAPEGVFIDNAVTTVIQDDPESGEFVLQAAPTNGQRIEASYYIQWFRDTELDDFMQNAGQWIGIGTDYTQIIDDLQPAATEYGAFQAYQRLSLQWAENMSATYKTQDAPDKDRWNPVQQYMNIAKAKYDLAMKLRDDVYKNRKGTALAPRFQNMAGRVKDVPPNR
jgi:hypothetical protein